VAHAAPSHELLGFHNIIGLFINAVKSATYTTRALMGSQCFVREGDEAPPGDEVSR
jgi:hypothetical protein